MSFRSVVMRCHVRLQMMALGDREQPIAENLWSYYFDLGRLMVFLDAWLYAGKPTLQFVYIR